MPNVLLWQYHLIDTSKLYPFLLLPLVGCSSSLRMFRETSNHASSFDSSFDRYVSSSKEPSNQWRLLFISAEYFTNWSLTTGFSTSFFPSTFKYPKAHCCNAFLCTAIPVWKFSKMSLQTTFCTLNKFHINARIRYIMLEPMYLLLMFFHHVVSGKKINMFLCSLSRVEPWILFGF